MKEGIYIYVEDMLSGLEKSLITGEHVRHPVRAIAIENTADGGIRIADCSTGEVFAEERKKEKR